MNKLEAFKWFSEGFNYVWSLFNDEPTKIDTEFERIWNRKQKMEICCVCLGECNNGKMICKRCIKTYNINYDELVDKINCL